MNKVYKKLFNIQYNNKTFTIFLDENNRRTFLEINENGKYVYPSLKDFVYLNNLYNNINPFVVAVTKYTFKEYVKNATFGVLAAVSLFNSFDMVIKNYNTYILENEVQIVAENGTNKEVIEIKDVSQLDEILGYKKVAIEDIHIAIDNNDLIPLKYKRKVHRFIETLNNQYSNLDLRIFYENIKTIQFVIIDSDYFKEQGTQNIGGQYNANLNQILIPENIIDEYLYHELSHVIDLFYKDMEDKIIYRGPIEKGSALNEAMTEVTKSCIAIAKSYDKYRAILEYFRKYVSFDYNTYNQKGIWYLIELLQEKYPSVDIDYIVCDLDTMKTTEKNGNYIYLDESMDLLDELFEICKIEASQKTENYYEPFSQFAKILYYTSDGKQDEKEPNTMYNYLEKYNEFLKEKNRNIECITKKDIIDKVSMYENLTSVAYKKNEVIPYIAPDEDEYIEKNGNKMNIALDYHFCKVTKELFYYMKLCSLEDYDMIGTNEYWKKITTDFGLLNQSDLKEIPIYWKGNLLGNEYIPNLSIAIGENKDGSIGYIIKNREEQILYQSDEFLLNKSNFVYFPDFLKKYQNNNYSILELSNVLNDYYLIDLLNDDNYFYNTILKADHLLIMPTYKLIIKDENMKCLNLGACYFINKNGETILYPLDYCSGYGKRYFLKDILDYYNVLNSNQLEYIFTKEELMEYYYNYRNDILLPTSKKVTENKLNIKEKNIKQEIENFEEEKRSR